jgi:tetratricopeptide (TPR) repeat protein
MKRFIAIVLFPLIMPAWSQTPGEIWNEANEAYTRSEYNYSIELYESLIEQEFQVSELYYNLGNAYFRTNQLGLAILNYERALRLNPSDDNIQHNLRHANSRTLDNIEVRAQLFYEQWWRDAYMMQSADRWAVLSIILLSLSLIAMAVYLFSRTIGVKKTAFFISVFLLFITVFSFIFAQKQYNRLTENREAIILSPRVSAKSSPSAQSPDLFLVHEGTKVFIRSTIAGWHEVNLANGNVGWIRRETAAII